MPSEFEDNRGGSLGKKVKIDLTSPNKRKKAKKAQNKFELMMKVNSQIQRHTGETTSSVSSAESDYEADQEEMAAIQKYIEDYIISFAHDKDSFKPRREFAPPLKAKSPNPRLDKAGTIKRM